MAKKNRRKTDREVWDALVLLFQFGIHMIVPIALCMALGIMIGNRTGATWVCVPLFFLGALAGATNIYRLVKKYLTTKDKTDRPAPGDDPSRR